MHKFDEVYDEKCARGLKTCPLCGSQAEVRTGKQGVSRKNFGGVFVESVVYCKHCGLELKRITEINPNSGKIIHNGFNEVIADWNRRTGNEKD